MSGPFEAAKAGRDRARINASEMQDRTAGKFCQVKSGSIKGAAQKCRKALQFFVYRQNQGCTAINGEHKKRGSAFHGSISPEQGMEPGPENLQTQASKTTEEKRVFFHMLGLLG